MPDHEPTTHVACEEPPVSEELRDALALLRDHSDDDEFRRLVDDVLAGRCSLVDASATPAFGAAVFGRVAQEFTEHVGRMADAEAPDAAAAAGPCGGCFAQCATPCASPPPATG